MSAHAAVGICLLIAGFALVGLVITIVWEAIERWRHE